MAEVNHSLIIPGYSKEQNLLAGALDLMSRAVALNDACSTLRLPYTYSLVRVPPAKQAARKQLGTMSVEIIQDMRDEVLEEAVRRYLESRGLTVEAVEAIFGGGNPTGTTGVDPALNRVEERQVEAAGAGKATGLTEFSNRELTVHDNTALAHAIKRMEKSD